MLLKHFEDLRKKANRKCYVFDRITHCILLLGNCNFWIRCSNHFSSWSTIHHSKGFKRKLILNHEMQLQFCIIMSNQYLRSSWTKTGLLCCYAVLNVQFLQYTCLKIYKNYCQNYLLIYNIIIITQFSSFFLKLLSAQQQHHLKTA